MRFRWALTFAALFAASVSAQTLYKYKGEDGEWIFTDRPPEDGQVDEVRELAGGDHGAVDASVMVVGRTFRIVGENSFYVPIEMQLRFTRIQGVVLPDHDAELKWVLPARSSATLLNLDMLANGVAPAVEYEVRYIIGNPDSVHRPGVDYRAPFALASDFPITQAYPDVITHTTPDSYHAVDIAMPVGTDIFAARAGIVFNVAGNNFRSGLNAERDGPAANVVQILHDDGTYSVYAHLNWNSIRVQPGERVSRGQYIADSGNTGFSSGPHLHFAVIRNAGMRSESVPVRFEGANSVTITPASGNALTAY